MKKLLSTISKLLFGSAAVKETEPLTAIERKQDLKSENENTIDEAAELSPEQAAAIIEEATRSNNYLGPKYQYYANIEGRPYENEMLNQLDSIDPSLIFSWADKQKDEGRYMTDRVFKRKNEIQKEYMLLMDSMFEKQQVAREHEANGDTAAAIAAYSELTNNQACPPFVFERLTILHRKAKDFDKEIEVCEQFIERHKETDPATCYPFNERMIKAKQLKNKTI